MELIALNFYIIFLLIIWIDGDITNILSKTNITRKLFKRDAYKKYVEDVDTCATYPCYLYDVYPSFITKVLSCSICLTFWLTLILNTIFFYKFYSNNWLIELIIWFPICYFVNLFLHLTIKKLL